MKNVDFETTMDIMLWGDNPRMRNWYHRLGDNHYFKFFNFQILRVFLILITFAAFCIMFYLDGRLLVLLL